MRASSFTSYDKKSYDNDFFQFEKRYLLAEKVMACAKINDINSTVEIIQAFHNEMLCENFSYISKNINKLQEQIELIPPKTISAVLRSTYRFREKIGQWNDFLSAATNAFEKQGHSTKLLKGLM